MNVLMINGSPRKSGNTSIALSEIAGQLEKLGIESEIVWIGNKPVRGCIACNKCKNNPGACIFNDDICNEISARMNASEDLLYIGDSLTELCCLWSSGCSIPTAPPSAANQLRQWQYAAGAGRRPSSSP